MSLEHLVVSDSFYKDAMDYLWRYDIAKSRLSYTKTQRAKLYIDLRLAIECSLKAHLAYWNKVTNIKQLTKYRHNTNQLFSATRAYLPDCITAKLAQICTELEHLPIGIRYSFEAYKIIEATEERYYKTIGLDEWLDRLEGVATELNSVIGKLLSSHSSVVTGDGLQELLHLEAPLLTD